MNIGNIAPILERVDSSHHWICRPDQTPEHVNTPVPPEKHGNPYARGACPIRRGESTTRLALLDLDSHKGETPWPRMAEVAGALSDALEGRGLCPVPFRSSGGSGMHLYMLWDEPQDAFSVREVLREALDACGLKNGTGGVAAGQVEIFPKQDRVRPDGAGSMFVLPLAGKSAALDPILDYEPVDYVDWQTSAPVPVRERKELAVAKSEPTADETELRELLSQLDPACSYDEWLENLAIIHHETEGEGLELAIEWSAPGWDEGRSKFGSCADEVEAKWPSFGHTDNPKTIATLRAKVGGRVATAADFEAILAPEHTADRPVIKLDDGGLHIYAEQCERVLSRDGVYQRDHKMVRIGGASELAESEAHEVRRAAGQPVILPASMEYVRRRLTARARFVKWSARAKKYVPKDCPRDLAQNICGQVSWSTLRPLVAIASGPFLRPDLSVCDQPGYDEASGVFYEPNGLFPPIPGEPTKEDARAALDALLAPFEEFPYGTPETRMAFAAHVLTEAVRTGIESAPIFFYTAPIAGTGKTLLAGMPARIVGDVEPAMRAWPGGEGEELKKVLMSVLLTGDRSVIFDNVPNGAKVRAPQLAIFATSAFYSDRKLGVSETPTMPNKTVVALTGNNLTPVADVARRSIVVRLDAGMAAENLRVRRFEISDLRAHVRAHRGDLLVAALTVVRAYASAGMPDQGLVPLPSFERWSRVVRDALVWLGEPDAVLTQEAEADDETGGLAEAFSALAAVFQGREFTSSDVEAEIRERLFDDGGRLGRALSDAGCNVGKVGYWLREKRGQVAGGWRLLTTKKGRLARYQLEYDLV